MKKLAFSILILFLLVSCSTDRTRKNNMSGSEGMFSEPEAYFSGLFIRDCCGFTGGDGTYSVLLPDGRNVWIFGDTFLGTVNRDKTRPRQSPIYIRNSFVVQEGDSLSTLHQKISGRDASMVIPPVGVDGEYMPEDSIWFWPGDGLIEDGRLKVFMSLFSQQDTGMWGFIWEGTWLATYTLPGIVEESLVEIPYGSISGIHLGHAIMEETDYTYVYGARDGKPHAARYPAGNVDGPWEFYTGSQWSSEPSHAGPMGSMHASEQFTVLKIKEKYVYVTQMEEFSRDICSFTSDTPWGPWENRSLLYTTPIPGEDKNLITYNALLHPQFPDKERILMSYNMNSFELGDHFRNADIYRPRFVWVPLKLIDPGF